MGVGAARSVRKRQQTTAARVARLVAGQMGTDAAGAEQSARRRSLKREVRRWIRAREAARERARAAEVRAGAALARLATGGLGLNVAASAVGLSRGTARRLVAAASSTGEPVPDQSVGSLLEPEPDQDRTPGHRRGGSR